MMLAVETTPLRDVLVLRPKVFGDERGYFVETFNAREFRLATGVEVDFVQDNQSRSARGVLRGLHYQVGPHAQGKLVRVLRGAIFDVAVDIRRRSPQLGQWAGIRLDDRDQAQIWIPPGFAHGFLVLSDGADVAYKTTRYYAPDAERCIRYDDPDIGIRWPCESPPTLSPRDADAAGFRAAELMP